MTPSLLGFEGLRYADNMLKALRWSTGELVTADSPPQGDDDVCPRCLSQVERVSGAAEGAYFIHRSSAPCELSKGGPLGLDAIEYMVERGEVYIEAVGALVRVTWERDDRAFAIKAPGIAPAAEYLVFQAMLRERGLG